LYPYDGVARFPARSAPRRDANPPQGVRAFSGHAHRDAMGLIAGIPVSSVPSVAIDLRLGEFPGAAATAPVYQIHRFDGDRRFVTETRIAA